MDVQSNHVAVNMTRITSIDQLKSVSSSIDLVIMKKSVELEVLMNKSRAYIISGSAVSMPKLIRNSRHECIHSHNGDPFYPHPPTNRS